MTRPFHPARALLSALALLAAGSSMATPVPFSGLDPNANSTVNPNGAPALAKDSFVKNLVAGSLQTEDFQAYSLGAQPSALFGGKATLSTAGTASTAYIENREIVNGGRTGRFNTSPESNGCTAHANDGSGCNWWETSQDFTLTFASAVSAFGFYGTDVGDFDGTLSLTLFKKDGTAGPTLDVTGTGGAAASNTLLFYGFTDTSGDTYGSIRFNVGQKAGGTTDYLGFDDLLIGNAAPSTTVPEPASLALVGISLAGLAVSRRSTRR